MKAYPTIKIHKTTSTKPTSLWDAGFVLQGENLTFVNVSAMSQQLPVRRETIFRVPCCFSAHYRFAGSLAMYIFSALFLSFL